MWKWLVFLLLLKNILSNATDPENVRETRQLNVDECCPCPTGRNNDQNTLESRKEVLSSDDCPCRNTLDSEGASSMFRPMFRAVEPSVRPANSNGDLKLLLKPEVGLASSVLETLREVTDEEYREAVLRDAARNEMNTVESNLLQKENTPRNLVNIILQPKNNNVNDVMPQASNIQPTSYIYPPVSPRNHFDESRSQSLKLFREALPLTKLANKGPKKVFDMENSASNIQEHLLQPLRNNLLEDLKLKSDMLKYKLFPNTRNGLRGAQQSFYNENKNIRGPECDNLEMPSLLDHFKKSKEKSSLPNASPVLIIEKLHEGNIMSTPINSEKRYSRINVPQSPIFEMPSDVDTTFIETPESVSNNDKSITNIILEDAKATENIACSINSREGQQINNFENTDDTQIDDAALSPSEINEITPLKTTYESKNNVSDESNISSREDVNTGMNDIQDTTNQLISEEVIPFNIKEFSDEEYVDVNKNIEDSVGNGITNKENEENSCNIKDSEVGASSNSFYSTGSHDNVSSIVNNPENNDNKVPIVKDALSTTTDKVDIKNNILKRIDNLKKSNQRLQEKLKSNVQDTLQYLKVKNNPLNEIDTGPPIKSIDDITENDNKNVNSQDLQEMSSRNINDIDILNKEIESSNYKSTSRENSEKTEDTYIGQQQKSHGSDLAIKTIDNPCDDFSYPSPVPGETEIDSSNTEMLSQASSPVAGSIQRPLNRDFLAESKPNLDVREALENLKFSVSDIFNNKKTSTFSPLKNNNDENKSTILSMIHKDRSSSKEPLPRFNEDRNVGKIHMRNYGNLPKVKQNNLDFYKARVPVPELLNTRSSVTLQKEDGTLPSNHGKVLQHFESIQGSYNRNKITGKENQRSEGVGFNNQKIHNIPDVLPSALLKNLQPRNDVLKNIKDTFSETLRQPLITNQNGILSNKNSKNIYGTILKTNDDLGEKLRAFHSELNDKISKFSQRISDVGSIPLQAQNKLKKPINIKETVNTRLKSDSRQIRPINKINGPRTPSNIGVPLKANSLQNRLSSSRRVGDSRSQIQNKASSKQTASESAKSITIKHPPKLNTEMNKSQLKKLRPFKDSKVTISFSTTTRPVLASGLKSIPRSKFGSAKSTDLKSRLLSNIPLKNRENLKQDSRTLASERITSRIPFPAKTTDISNESLDLSDETTDSRSDNTRNFKGIMGTDERKIDNSVLSKIREAVKARARNVNKNNDEKISNINSDASQSASNVNEVKINDKALKENVSYKCKMICFEDKLD